MYTRNPDVILRPLRDVRDHRRGQEANGTAPFLNTKLARPHVRSAYQPVLRAGTWHKDDIVQRSTVQRSTRRASETHSVISNQVPGVFACSRCTVLQALPVCRSGTVVSCAECILIQLRIIVAFGSGGVRDLCTLL